jgi:hypothetical protein
VISWFISRLNKHQPGTIESPEGAGELSACAKTLSKDVKRLAAKTSEPYLQVDEATDGNMR